MRSIAILAALLSLMMSAVVAELGKPPTDFDEFKEWQDGLSVEERLEFEHSISENNIERHGVEVNDFRLCTSVYQNFTQADFYIKKEWAKNNVRYLDTKRYNDWVVNAPKGSKPWIILFAETSFSQPLMT